MTVLVTGAAGFIGQHLVALLVRRGETVHALCRKSSPQEWQGYPNVKVFRGDILNPESVEVAMKGCDHVFHLAGYARNWAKNPQVFFDVNVGGLKTVLESARALHVHRVVFTSSALTLGPSHGVPLDGSEERSAPTFTAYERSKCKAEALALQHFRGGLDIVIVNPTRVFGPGLLNEGNSATRMIKWYLEGKWRITIGTGQEIGNYAFAPDVALGHLLAMERGKAGERYILGGENICYTDLFNLVAGISGKRHSMVKIPSALALAYAAGEESLGRWFRHQPLITPGWVRTFLCNWACSCSKAEREIGYRFTPLREALKETISWLCGSQQQNIEG